MSKYKREDFSEKEMIDGVNEVDLPMNGFNEFVFNGSIGFYTVTESDLKRPDLICLNVYGTTNMWWLLFKYNKIEDIWNDMFVGMVLEVPKLNDLENYYISRN